MGETVRSGAHWESLLVIASEELGIHSLDESGKVRTDVRLVKISSLAQALDRAYDFGLLMGHTVSLAEHPKTKPSKLTCRADQEWVRAAAKDIFSTCWH